jgi:hypothetical protein
MEVEFGYLYVPRMVVVQHSIYGNPLYAHLRDRNLFFL